MHNWTTTQIHSQAMADLVREYTSANPQTEVEMEYSPSGAPYVVKLQSLLAGGTPPNVATLLLDFLPTFSKPPALANLEKLLSARDLAKADLFEGPQKSVSAEGGIIGLPYISTNVAAQVNLTAFQRAGMPPPREDWTWEDLTNSAKRLTRQEEDGKSFYGVNLPWGAGVTTAQHWLAALWQAGGEVLDRNGSKASFHGEAGIDALQLWVDLLNAHRAAQPSTAQIDFNKGDMAIGPNWVGAVGATLKASPPFDWTTLPLPRKKQSATTLSGHALTVLKDAPAPAASARFVSWFTSGPQLARFNAQTTTLPPRRSAQAHKVWQELVSSTPQLKAYSDSMQFARAAPIHARWTDMGEVIAGAVNKAMKLESSPRSALGDAARQVDQLLAQA